MNIFVTSPSPLASARALDDRRLIKMVLETAQLLCTAHHVLASPLALLHPEKLYRQTHTNHPCAIWARASSGNYTWLAEHGLALAAEYTHRYAKTHACTALLHLLAENPPAQSPNWPSARTPFANAARNTALELDFTPLPVPKSYQHYLAAKWQAEGPKARWTNRTPPAWFKVLST